MKLTTKSEYSLLALIYIARHQEEAFVPIEDICNAYGLPRKYMEQLIAVLKQNRLVRPRRGAGGGYRLARPAEEIRMADIIRLMDGALAPVESVSTYFYTETALEQEPKVLAVFKEIRDFIAAKLEGMTLAELL